MRLIADLEIHSKYSRAVSKNATVENNALWAQYKGVDVTGTGDFTHPEWRKMLKEKLEDDGTGLLTLKKDIEVKRIREKLPRFLLSGEVSCIYRKHDKTRRVHLLIYAPSFDAADGIANDLSKRGKLASDGRPILGMDSKDVLQIVLDHGGSMIPAHVWTPWFGLFGSKSGFDSIEECFEELTPFIYAIETGLSSDPPMNWRMEFLDDKRIVSFSDSHSSPNIGREATVFEVESASYQSLFRAIQNPDKKNRIVQTIEFFPEEGMYHFDGHRTCGFSCDPVRSNKMKNVCPKCRRELTIGVLNRVESLAVRPEGYTDPNRPPFTKIVPLPELIAWVRGVGKHSKTVMSEYYSIVEQRSEFDTLVFSLLSELSMVDIDIRKAIVAMREGDIQVVPGYDGVYGTISISKQAFEKQSALF